MFRQFDRACGVQVESGQEWTCGQKVEAARPGPLSKPPTGFSNNCIFPEFFGFSNLDHQGCFGSSIAWDVSALFRIPDAIASEDAGPLMCGGATVFSPLHTFDVQPGDRVGIVGILPCPGPEGTNLPPDSQRRAHANHASGADHVWYQNHWGLVWSAQPRSRKPQIEKFPLTKDGVVDAMARLREGKMRYRGKLVVPQ
ncbi:alcohol dehydrogenase [Metarhizium rileyi]|uniref:Alcohol dehydrogenase n=1 Tax=Metarhizium rileyi (strain RCEF 4871) TaxID=1649241 RepID=A0A162JUF7_METRR|nr:alcohol dehydrogenase [Metarhizium rileyi RCEF 4871]